MNELQGMDRHKIVALNVKNVLHVQYIFMVKRLVFKYYWFSKGWSSLFKLIMLKALWGTQKHRTIW